MTRNAVRRIGVIGLLLHFFVFPEAVAGAERPVPSTALMERLNAEEDVIGIVHWGLNTYTDKEWGYGDEKPEILNPAKFDADQIAKACAAGGLKGLVIVAKHHDGFCLWPTKTTEHNITKSPFRGGKGDYVREMADACRRAGMKFGVYVSPWDRNNADYSTEKYVETYHAQIKELLGGDYGEVFEMWFDGANGGDGYYGGAREKRKIPSGYYRFDEVLASLRELQPKVTFFGAGGEFCWPGNERGTVDPEKSASKGGRFRMWEADFPLRPGWFYHGKQKGKSKHAAYLMNRYLASVGNGGTMDIGIAPNKDGLLDEEDVKALKGFGDLRKVFFANEVTDVSKPFNLVVLREDLSDGEQVASWSFLVNDEKVLSGELIGYKRVRILDRPMIARRGVRVIVDKGKVSHRLYFVDPELVKLVQSATTESGETDTAKWMTGAEKEPKRSSVRRVFREARHTRGNTNITKVQPIDDAAWIWLKGEDAAQPTFLKFRNEFEVKEGDGKLVIDVSADERYYLTCDGVFVSRGPNRSTVENWQYNTYEIDLKPGRHVIEATVWKTNDDGPLAQLSWRGGFILKACAAYDKRLTTGVAKWKVGRLAGIRPAGADNGVWGTGSQWEITGSGIIASEPVVWSDAEVVRGFAGAKGPNIYGGRTNGWMLFPSQLPDQTEDEVRPGRIVAVTQDAPWRGRHVYTEVEARESIDFSKSVTIPAKTRIQLCWDLGRYICAYPVLRMKGAKGARVSWTWAEATQRGTDDLKGGEPDARNAIVGRYLNGYGDIFVCDGEREGVFTTPWFRCGKWCRIDIETGDKPLEIADIHLVESRYPLEMKGVFASKDDASLADIRTISARAMQMCCHEMLFDCPYYEQQMYPGDTRVQLNVLSAMSRDERMVKRAIELFDLSARDDGQCPFNWPTRGTQEGATYTLCYLLMYGDYVMNHADRAWLRARLPGLRKAMAGMELYENADGLLENMPGWQFMDWVVGWRSDGTAPGGRFGEGVNAEANLFWSLAMRSAALTERALGNELQARYWEAKRERLNAKIVETFWCEARGIFADTPEMKDFSEHAQCLALIGDVLPEEKAKVCFGHLVADPDLKRTTVYFNFYLFECYFKFGRGDLFLKRLDLWREYVKKGLTTTQEAPDWTDGNGRRQESRSDCHAWGAHPIWFMQTGLAGIRSDAPFFDKVLVAPSPGALTEIQAKHPHPQGFVEVDLKFANGTASGTVKTPVPGTFVFGNQRRPLVAGENRIEALGGGPGTLGD